MIRKRVIHYENVPADILNFSWKEPVSKPLQNLKCTTCKQPIADKKWALAWIRENGKEYSARLCEKCGEVSEIAFNS